MTRNAVASVSSWMASRRAQRDGYRKKTHPYLTTPTDCNSCEPQFNPSAGNFEVIAGLE